MKNRQLRSTLIGTIIYVFFLLFSSQVQGSVAHGIKNKPKTGFSVDIYAVERPFWEIFTDDLNGDGIPEVVACDVDGVVTVRTPGSAVMLSLPLGALVYQFASGDLNNDGIKEIIVSSVDPTVPVTAYNLKGKTIQVFGDSKGPERMAVADMDMDGKPELAVSIDNLKEGTGTAAGLILYKPTGEAIWKKPETLREFQFGDLIPGNQLELVTGGSRLNFRVYNKAGDLLETRDLGKNMLDHFLLNDVDDDGILNIIASHESGSKSKFTELLCAQDNAIIWNIRCPEQLKEDAWDYSAIQTVIFCADFDTKNQGNETVVVGTNYLFLFDSKGGLLYQNHEGFPEYWGSWVPGGINLMDLALWNGTSPELFVSSSRYRDKAFYKLTYGNDDVFGSLLLEDQEIKLDEIYKLLKNQPIKKSEGKQKIKVFMEMNPLLAYTFSVASEDTLRLYRQLLDKLESPDIEYLVNWDPNTPMPRNFRYKLTDDQIVERARLFEKTGIPFGYWASHAGRIWVSDDVIRRSKEVAPTMFRFVCAVENLERFYTPGVGNWMKWVEKTLDFCADHQMKMIFKDKQDSWGLLPADTTFANVMFNPKYRDVVVPAFSTNQPFHFETQLGGLLGLKMAGLCNEFGISSQYWNWHEWGGYPRGIRDISPTTVCPSDIVMRLDLLGLALGATWINLEHGQPYFRENMFGGLSPMTYRHREIAFELIRKNILVPGATPVNMNKVTIVRSLNPAIIHAKEVQKQILYPYYDRNTEELRKGFIPARYMFEPYPEYSFPRIAYQSLWNASTCFPQTPFGWIPVLPPQAKLRSDRNAIFTDGEKVLLKKSWENADQARSFVAKTIAEGAKDILIDAPGTCLIVQNNPAGKNMYTAILIDSGYLAPTGVETILTVRRAKPVRMTDMISGENLSFKGNHCPIKIQPGAFRIIRIELAG